MERKLLLGIAEKPQTTPKGPESEHESKSPKVGENPKVAQKQKRKIKILVTKESPKRMSGLDDPEVEKPQRVEKRLTDSSAVVGKDTKDEKKDKGRRGKVPKPKEELDILIEGTKTPIAIEDGTTFKIGDLKKLLLKNTGWASFQLRFEVNKKVFLGTPGEEDGKLAKTLARISQPLPPQPVPFSSFLWGFDDLFSPLKGRSQVLVKVLEPNCQNIASFVRGVGLQNQFGDDTSELGLIDVVHSSDSGFCQAVPKLTNSPKFIVFKIRKFDAAGVKLNLELFRLSYLSREEKKVKRKEVPTEVDPATLVYAVNSTATVVARVLEELKAGVYEVSFGFDQREVVLKEHPDFRFPTAGYSAWFILGRTEELNCTLCLEEKMHQNHFVCGVCLGIECVKCVEKFYAKNTGPFVCQSCRNSMFRQ